MVIRYNNIIIETRMLWEAYMGESDMTAEDEIQRIRELKDVLSSKDLLLLYYNTKYWKEMRLKVLERDGFCCRGCGSKIDLQIDHIFYGPIGKEKLSFLQTLCVFCHASKSKKFNVLENYNHRKVKLSLDSAISGVMR